ncbi:hypothetical protein NDU88_008434 [Pleurodeles waltl]|uniref:Uncharacterized protein n=1 Tax=Pleurodeles waltl TaxID=8319 RepID=A0AAV7QNH9_PLEWA|nr:hypothetical protein NDU88_008434 [Pleurodeles waltl]
MPCLGALSRPYVGFNTLLNRASRDLTCLRALRPLPPSPSGSEGLLSPHTGVRGYPGRTDPGLRLTIGSRGPMEHIPLIGGEISFGYDISDMSYFYHPPDGSRATFIGTLIGHDLSATSLRIEAREWDVVDCAVFGDPRSVYAAADWKDSTGNWAHEERRPARSAE